jgi:hypothetical protein
LLSFSRAKAATYYFSTSQGDDSRTMQQAQNSGTPWKTIAKLNAIFSSLNAGDVVMFNRGEIFEGTIIATKSGVAGNPIVFSAYGTGAKPVISGFVQLRQLGQQRQRYLGSQAQLRDGCAQHGNIG